MDIKKICSTKKIHIMGILNTSPESFYKSSIHTTIQSIWDRAKAIEDEGGSIIDVGGMSTAPYLNTMVSQQTETERIIMAIKTIKNACNLPISIDTCRAEVAQAALKEDGISIINDITGLKYDQKMADVIKLYDASVILGAYGGKNHKITHAINKNNSKPKNTHNANVQMVRTLLEQSFKIALDAGIKTSKIAIDPSIGFFRDKATGDFYTKISSDWITRDIEILSNLAKLRHKQYTTPIVVSVSNKSFLGSITDRKHAHERIHASVAAETIAMMYGANIIRTHNVAAAHDAALTVSRLDI